MRTTLILTSMLLLTAPVWADGLDDSAQRTNQLADQQDAQQVASQLSSSFSQLAGSPENANALVSGLRTGQSISLRSDTGQVVSVAGTGKSLGWGGVNNTLALAQASLQKANITNPGAAELALAVGNITSLRSSGMGWGQIANSLGLNLGQVVSSTRNTEKALAQRGRHSGIESEHGVESEQHADGLHKSGTQPEHAGKVDDGGVSGRNRSQTASSDDSGKGRGDSSGSQSSGRSGGDSGKGSGGSSGSSGGGGKGGGGDGGGGSGKGGGGGGKGGGKS